MKLIICGGRDYHLDDFERGILRGIDLALGISEVVSGACQGVDKDGEAFAKEFDIPVKQFMPNWDDEGSAAGPIRNQLMADYADACIAFRGGKGTEDMVRRATEAGLKVWDFR